MDDKVLLASVQDLLLRVNSTSPEKAAEIFRDLPGRDVFVPRLKRWLENNRSSFPEPFIPEDLDSLFDPGVDLLLVGARSGAKIGFQIKSDNDLRSKNFTRDLKAQILDAQRIGVDLIVVVFACAPTKKNRFKIKFWQNYVLVPTALEILCLPPERAAGLYELFDLPIEPIVLSARSWPNFFRSVGQPRLASHYLDTWPSLLPDRRFLAPEGFDSIRRSLRENRLTFLVGSPAAGKTFTSVQLLWDAFQECRPIHWITATDAEPTEGPIPKTETDLVARTELGRRVDGLLRHLGSPKDAIDIVSRVLVPDALVYIEDPFGKSEEEYDLSLSSYNFFDLHRFVEELDKSTARADCRVLITSREALFQRWLSDLKIEGRERPQCSVIRLTHSGYYPGPLFRHAVLLGQARGFSEPEAVADVLVDHVESPFELEMLILSLSPLSGITEAEDVVAGWEGDLHTKIEDRITPRDDRDALVLLLIAASASQYDSLQFPLEIYAKLHSALTLEGEPRAVFSAILKRMSPFLDSQGRGGLTSLPFVPSHTVVREAIGRQLASAKYRQLLCRVARALPDIGPNARPRKPPKGIVSLAYHYSDPWSDHFLVALYLLSLGIAREGKEENEALEQLLFGLVGIGKWRYREIMRVWRELPTRFRERILDSLQGVVHEGSAYYLREVAAFLPHANFEPPDAWRVLALLLEDPGRGSQKTKYDESPWAYLFLHLDEVPQDFLAKLDAWAREDPAFFFDTMGEGLLKRWNQVPVLWRNGMFGSSLHIDSEGQNRFVWITASQWGEAPQSFRELFDFLARSPDPSVRARVGSRSIFYAERYPDLERYALEAIHDPDPMVRWETFRWGRGDDIHRRIAETLLACATPKLAVEIMLDLLEEDIRDEIAPWEKDVLERCKQIAGDAARAAIASAIFAGKERPHELGYKLCDSPFDEPEIARAVWLWRHLNSDRSKPLLSDDDLKKLLLELKEPRIRAWCLAVVASKVTKLPESFHLLLSELGESSSADARAIRLGEEARNSKRSLVFRIGKLMV